MNWNNELEKIQKEELSKLEKPKNDYLRGYSDGYRDGINESMRQMTRLFKSLSKSLKM